MIIDTLEIESVDEFCIQCFMLTIALVTVALVLWLELQ